MRRAFMRTVLVCLVLGVGVYLSGCGEEKTEVILDDSTGSNNPPQADAGPDRQVATGEPVDLDGSGSSDPEGDTLFFEWHQNRGEPVEGEGWNSEELSFTAPAESGELRFVLTVQDEGDPPGSDTDEVTVTVVGDPGDPCDPDPCQGIQDAVADTCTAVGQADFTCDCDTGFAWDDSSNTCEEDPCDPDPCQGIQDAVAGTCADAGGGDFTCDCDAGFVWDNATNMCEVIAVDPCDPDPCLGIQDAVAGTCAAVGQTDFTCDCDVGFDWDDATNMCEAVDPCDPDPCLGIQDAVAGTCADAGGGDFTCDCDAGLIWEDSSNTCEEDPAIVSGRADYDLRCASCHKAGDHDTEGGFSDLAGDGSKLVSDLSTINAAMPITMSQQEIDDMAAFLDSL